MWRRSGSVVRWCSASTHHTITTTQHTTHSPKGVAHSTRYDIITTGSSGKWRVGCKSAAFSTFSAMHQCRYWQSLAGLGTEEVGGGGVKTGRVAGVGVWLWKGRDVKGTNGGGKGVIWSVDEPLQYWDTFSP
ncbi:hypothetical protein E2C01_095416 [Portunus trituberculatus]|uniref:Uncharacterized protein n=1 Tax=Portunus trituberculatus TaxID=210409 RepID=A0A5B7JYN2_PORTR|nr:hypothetical protein [Portunus trituberculatus]